ncbi:bifunctional diguanylate cyclase/phosphodiesterase [Caminibacter mediatlanticus TB-2]|uniref:Bifunctional diguanylate cyclase/phosphodiesterase n=1 Tax=Caminibacter mediatlanticus TB-2 TaxID=391592 RepID=A0ABX5V787_9BACT|nr:bifunctional diguanylate cyclase/phosphodiesterase [Caminibacter mediatlanticus]QCT93844.1 bifunctional diguanylate cyclase/phosphodiesterase [Caminibacter mediatlanticus TB-2]
MTIGNYLLKLAIRFIIIILFTFFLIYILMKYFEKEFNNAIMNIEIQNAFNTAYKVEKILNSHYKNKNDILNLLLNKDIKYVFIIKKINGKYKYIYDGSPINERAIKYQPFEPLNKKIWEKVYTQKTPVYEINKKIDNVWLTFLYPIIKQNKINYIIAMDISLNAYNKFNDLLKIFKNIFIIVVTFILLLIFYMNFFIFKFYKEKFQSLIDPLTNTYNRKIINRIENENIKKTALLIFDIDNFKKINDTYGHNIGDIVLKNLTQTIKSQIRSNDYLIRYGGEEFLLILNNIEQKDALKKIEKIFNTIRNTPINIGNKKLFITISGGVHLEPEKEKNIFEAIKKADQELYKAKRTGKNKYCIYSENSEKIFAINEITDFIESNSILVYLQPILNIKTNKIEKFEALARIKYKDEIFSPNTFLENIKNTNTYRDFTSIILDKVFKTISKYKVEISVNFFAKDFFDEKFITLFDEKEKKYKDLLSFLSIEILENEQIENIQKLQNQLKILKEKGIKISIDDFGSDYSNLSYLTYITPDYIKIDSSIVKEVRSNINAQKIIKTIVILAKEFNAKTIAEFVEDKDSFKILKSLNVDYIQGYYISLPLPIEEIEKII